MTSPSPRRPVTRTVASAAATALLIGALVAAPTLTGTTNFGGGPAHAHETATPSQTASPSQAAAPTTVSTSQSSQTYGAVSGTVLNAATKAPVSGVTVSSAPYVGSKTVRQTVTAEDGTYRLGGLKRGVRAVSFSTNSTTNLQRISVNVTIKAGIVGNLETEMHEGATVSGTVVDSRGELYPAGTTYVEFAQYIEEYEGGHWSGPQVALDSRGRFTATGVALGTTKFAVSYCPSQTTCQRRHLSTAKLNAGQSITLALKGSVPFDSDWGELDEVDYVWEEEREAGMKPQISGKPTAGRTVAAKLNAWSPRPTTLKYRWLRDGTPIGGAIARKYKVRKQDIGHRLSVRVTGSRAHFLTATRVSTDTARVTR